MNQFQMHPPKLSLVNKFLIVISGALFLLGSILKAIGAFSLVGYLGLSASGVLSGMVWQFLTYPFMEAQLLGFIFNSLLIWFIGSELEQLWGSKLYLRFLLFVTIPVGLIYCAIGLIFFYGTSVFFNPLFGLTGINFAILIAYAMLYPDRQLSLMMVFPMRARTFCWILVGIEAYMAIFSSYLPSWGHLLAMGLSYLIVRFQTIPIFSKILNFTWRGKKSSKKHLYVVKDDDSNFPKYWQ